jgi:hypothetical protein
MDYVRVVVKGASQPQVAYLESMASWSIFCGVEVGDRAIPQLD